MIRLYLCYGKKQVKLELPAGFKLQELRLHDFVPIRDPLIALKKSLRQPISSPPLRDCVHAGDRVCILVNDSTRIARSELLLPIIISELQEARIEDKDIFIVFAAGTHRPLTRSEMISLVGKQIADRYKLYNHNCHDQKELIYIGETIRSTPVYVNKKVFEADKRILTGSIVHHFFAGFGGGRKALIPGVAGFETIESNHNLMIDQKARLGILKNNPVHEDLLEAALMVGGDFILNVVLNEQKQILGIFAGNMVKAHEEGCSFANQVYGVKINALADVVIASCGGYPKDLNVYQVHKTLENALMALKEGGKIILLAQCSEGVGSAVYEEWATRYKTLTEIEQEIKVNFQIGGHKAYAIARAFSKGDVILVSDLNPEKARALGFIPASSLNEAISIVFKDASHDILTYIIPQSSLVVPISDRYKS